MLQCVFWQYSLFLSLSLPDNVSHALTTYGGVSLLRFYLPCTFLYPRHRHQKPNTLMAHSSTFSHLALGLSQDSLSLYAYNTKKNLDYPMSSDKNLDIIAQTH